MAEHDTSFHGNFKASRMREIVEQTERLSLQSSVAKRLKRFYRRRFNSSALIKFLLVRFPIIEIVFNYKKKHILLDCLAGAAVGFVHIAQGLAYGNLAGVSTAYGLYVSLFAPIFYAIFGESKHLSIGTIAVMSLLIRENTENCVTSFLNETSPGDEAAVLLRSEVVITLAMMTGLLLVTMAIFRLGILISYLTDALISGYLCAAAIFVLTSQIPSAFGFPSSREKGFAIFFLHWVHIFKKIKYSNPATSITFLLAFIPLALGRYLNNKYIKYVKIALPLEIIIIAIGTIVCNTTDVINKYNITSIGSMPMGLPVPSVPSSKYVSCIGTGFFSVAIVTIALNFSIVSRFADKHLYSVSMNQELFAYGITDILISFFSCFPSCGAISRTAVGSSNLQQSQLASIVSSLILLTITFTITKYLQFLPLAILSAIVIVSIIPTILQIGEALKFWRVTKIEGLVWVCAFFATLFLDLDIGLFLSIAASLLLNTITIQRPKIKVLGRIKGCPGIFLDKNIYSDVEEIEGIKIITIEAPLVSYNASIFKQRVVKECGYPKGHKNPAIYDIHLKILSLLRKDHPNVLPEQDSSTHFPEYLIIDCSAMFAVDSNGLQVLLELNDICYSYGTQLLLCCVREQLLRAGCNAKFFDNFDDKYLFLSVEEATLAIEKDNNTKDFANLDVIKDAMVQNPEKSLLLSRRNLNYMSKCKRKCSSNKQTDFSCDSHCKKMTQHTDYPNIIDSNY